MLFCPALIFLFFKLSAIAGLVYASNDDNPLKVVSRNKTEIRKHKHQLISSHTCRHSFCTNQFLAGMPTILICKIVVVVMNNLFWDRSKSMKKRLP